MTQAYHQFPVEKESRKILSINTEKGLFEPTRLPYGIKSASSICQRVIDNLLKDCEGSEGFQDDIIVSGRTLEEHDVNLEKVLSKLKEMGVTLNRDKCIFGVPSLVFLGHIISADGIKPTLENYVHILPDME